MVNLDLADEHVYPERDVILEERRSRVDNEPSALLGEQLMAAQYLHHPYRLPVIGWFHEIAGYTREDAVDFYRQYYAPNNAILVVAGDVTAAELRPLAERTYGQIPARPVVPRHRLVEPPQHAERRVVLHHERVRQPSLMRSYLAPELQLAGPRACLCAGRAGRDPGRRRHQPAVPGRGGRAGSGGRRRCLLPRLQPRCGEFPGLCEPAAGRGHGRAGARDGPRDRPRSSPMASPRTSSRARSGACWPRPSMPATRWVVLHARSAWR